MRDLIDKLQQRMNEGFGDDWNPDEDPELAPFKSKYPEVFQLDLEDPEYMIAGIIDWLESHKARRNPDGSYDLFGDVQIDPEDMELLADKWGKLRIKIRKVKGNFGCFDCNFTTAENFPVWVEGNMDISVNYIGTFDLKRPIQYVGKDFNCSDCGLGSLKGGPKYVGGSYNCSFNFGLSFEGVPKKINGDFDCKHCGRITLEGAPEYVDGNFDCSDNKLTSLKGAPKYVGGDFICNDNTKQFTEEDVRSICEVKGRVIV